MLCPEHDAVVNTPHRPQPSDEPAPRVAGDADDPRLQRILDRLQLGVTRRYPGEPISHWEHALQTAHRAQQARASEALVSAALLHDIGHLEDDIVDTASSVHGVDDRHEARGARWLAELFGPAVTEPIRLHVQAKRYLVGRSPGYAAALSTDSQRSLKLQGGPMSAAERDAFDRTPYAADAIRLRCWDDLAKDPGASSLRIESFLVALRRSVQRPLGERA